MVRAIKLPLGVKYLGSQVFDPNVGLDFVAFKPLPIKETLSKANKIAEKYGIEPIRRPEMSIQAKDISAEVGDDELSLTQSKAFVLYQTVVQTDMGMKVSEEDTSINSRYGNFAEDLVVLPDGYGQTYLNSRKSSRFKDMSFIDVPKLRLAIDIRPMRMDHSGTNDGKASMVGSRQRWIPLDSPVRGIYELFSLFQDVNLGLTKDRKYPYFPESLGGYGKEIPFRNPHNFERFMHSYRNGKHSELIREVVRELNLKVGEMNSGKYTQKSELLSHLVRFQSSFHDWIKGKSIYAPVCWVDVPTELAKWSIGKMGRSRHEDEVISRLLAERKILSESNLQVAVEHNELCKSLLGAKNVIEAKSIRDAARKEWQNLSIFNLESYNFIKEINLVHLRRGPLRADEYHQFMDNVSMKRYNLKHILKDETVYDVKAMDEIYRTGPMKVQFEMMPRVGMHSRGFAASSLSYRTAMEDTEEIGKLDELLDWLRSNSVTGKSLLPVPTVLINDDEPIIRECSFYAYNIIITDDKKLCREANRRTGKPIFRVPVLWYYLNIYYGSEHWSEHISKRVPGLEWKEHEDTGSIKSFEETHFLDGVLLSKASVQKFNFWKELGVKDTWESYPVEDPDAIINANIDIDANFYDWRNVLRIRRNIPRKFGKPKF